MRPSAVLLVAALLSCLALAGCSGTGNGTSTVASSPAAAKPGVLTTTSASQTGVPSSATPSSAPSEPSGTSTSTSASPASPGPTLDVQLSDNQFGGGDRTLALGTAVHFTNGGTRSHTVTIHKAGEPTDQLRSDKVVQPNTSTDYAFSEAGTYHVWCRFHGTMTGGMAVVYTVQ